MPEEPAQPQPTPAPSPAPKKQKRESILTRAHIPFKQREYFSENLALLLKSAVPIGEAIQALASTTEGRALKKALLQMNSDIEAGYSLADALDRAHLVSKQTLALARLGENSGHLVENLQLAAQQEEKRHAFRAKIRSAMIYPSFVLSLTVIVGLGVAWFLLPRLAGTFSTLHVKLPLVSRLLINTGIFLKAHGVVAVPLFFVFCLATGIVLFGLPQTKPIGQKILFAIPGIGALMREVEVAQFGYLLGTLLDAGLPVTQALRLLANASNAVRYQRLYSYLAESLDDGYSFRDSLRRYPHVNKLLPPAVQQMIVSGEHSGSLSEVLLTVGRVYEQKSDIMTENLEAIIEPILLVVVWLGVMLVAVAVIVPVYSLVGGLGNAAK